MLQRRTFLRAVAMATAGGGLIAEKEGLIPTPSDPVSDSIEEPARSIPVVEDCDVCVLGGSCTGVFAAVRAAQMGSKVSLVEKQNAFGGVATAGLVHVWHKLYSNQSGKQIIGGLTHLVLQRLEEIGAAQNRGKQGYTLNTDELKIELDSLVMENRIFPFLHTLYAAPFMEGPRVNAVFIENKTDARPSGQRCLWMPQAMATWPRTLVFLLRYGTDSSRPPRVRKSQDYPTRSVTSSRDTVRNSAWHLTTVGGHLYQVLLGSTCALIPMSSTRWGRTRPS